MTEAATASATCGSCDAPIIWALTANGKRMPLDAEPVERPRGLFTVDDDGNAVLDTTIVYRSHFATCPNAAQHRKSR